MPRGAVAVVDMLLALAPVAAVVVMETFLVIELEALVVGTDLAVVSPLRWEEVGLAGAIVAVEGFLEVVWVRLVTACVVLLGRTVLIAVVSVVVGRREANVVDFDVGKV